MKGTLCENRRNEDPPPQNARTYANLRWRPRHPGAGDNGSATWTRRRPQSMPGVRILKNRAGSTQANSSCVGWHV